MRFIYSEHARQNLLERRISPEQVELTILFPDKLIKSQKGRLVAQKNIGQLDLRVVYLQTEKAYIIVTAYYTKVGRY